MPIQSYTANFSILQKCHISIMQYFCNISYPNIIVIPDGMEHFLRSPRLQKFINRLAVAENLSLETSQYVNIFHRLDKKLS